MRELIHAVVWWARVVTDGATVAALYRTLREIGHRRLPALWGGIVLHWRAARYSWALQRMMDTDIDHTLAAEEA